MLYTFPIHSQALLKADGPDNTYELINSVLAPGYDVVESPDCAHPEFGRHILEILDADLNEYVFQFNIHVTPDNDRCIEGVTDRQRMEIKTYESSPDNLKGVVGETVTYKWKFKLPFGFQSSSNFTHIHQIKAVNGEDGDPLFTLTPRKGSPNKLELIHDNTTKVAIVNLSDFENTWVECTEVIKIGSSGTYSMSIKKVSDGTSLLSYSNNSIMTIRDDNDFIRPKWGIYRSLLSSSDLRDEAVLFSDFYIGEETATTLPNAPSDLSAVISSTTQIDLTWTDNSFNEEQFRIERSNDGISWNLLTTIDANSTTYSDTGLNLSTSYYYRVRAENTFGNSSYTNTVYFIIGKIVSIQNGNWNSISTWSSNSVPFSTDNVEIVSGDTVVISGLLNECSNLAVNGDLNFATDGTVSHITVNGDVTIGSNGDFTCANLDPVHAYVSHTATFYGNFTNTGGDFDFRVGSNGTTGNGVDVTFAGSTDATITVTQTTYSNKEEFNSITINKTGGSKVTLSGGNLFQSNNSSTGPSYLIFVDGMIETGSNIWATMVTSSSGVQGGSTTSYVNGKLGRGLATSGGTNREFEIGTSSGYRPLKLYSTTGLASKSFVVASIIEGNAANGSTLSGGIEKVSELRYYEITAYVGATMSAATVSINELRPSYLDNDGVTSGNTNLRVAYSTDSRANWIGIGQSSTHTTDPKSTPTTIEPDVVTPALTLDETTTTIDVAIANAPDGGNALPVELISFSANTINGSLVLTWNTATEVNNYGFEIESSNDKVTWSLNGFVEGHGNSNSPKEYSFVTKDVASYYRLKQIDTEGSYCYSDEIEITFNLSYQLNQNHPNPFNPSTTISYSLPKSTQVNLVVYNALGQQVVELVNETMDAGTHQVNFDASQLTSGMYFYKIQTGDFSKTMKMMLLK